MAPDRAESMVMSISFEEENWVVFAKSMGGSSGAVRENHGDFLGDAVLLCDVEVIYGSVMAH
jgi:hypothetical protein